MTTVAAVLGFRLDRGTIDGVDVSGRTVVLAILTPKLMVEGNWQAGLLIDEDASDEQIELLTKVFSGQDGGPMAGLSPLITDFLGAERAAIDLRPGQGRLVVARRRQHRDSPAPMLRAPDTDEDVALTGIFAHPAGPTLTVTPGATTRWSLLGIDFSGEGSQRLHGTVRLGRLTSVAIAHRYGPRHVPLAGVAVATIGDRRHVAWLGTLVWAVDMGMGAVPGTMGLGPQRSSSACGR